MSSSSRAIPCPAIGPGTSKRRACGATPLRFALRPATAVSGLICSGTAFPGLGERESGTARLDAAASRDRRQNGANTTGPRIVNASLYPPLGAYQPGPWGPSAQLIRLPSIVHLSSFFSTSSK